MQCFFLKTKAVLNFQSIGRMMQFIQTKQEVAYSYNLEQSEIIYFNRSEDKYEHKKLPKNL